MYVSIIYLLLSFTFGKKIFLWHMGLSVPSFSIHYHQVLNLKNSQEQSIGAE